MSEHIKKSHNKSLLLYHLVCPAKYRREVFTPNVAKTLKDICQGISERYEIHFVEIGTDEDHVHFLIQSVPTLSPQQITQTVKSLTGRLLFQQYPEVKTKLWGGQFWTKGYYVNTVGQYASEGVIANYVKNQGRIYEQIHHAQPTLFEGVV